MALTYNSLWKSTALVALFCWFGGCTSYRPVPLPNTADLATATEQTSAPLLSGPPAGIPALEAYALANNPDLKAARQKHLVAQAAQHQAGLLPNPSFSGAVLPLISGAGTVPAWSIGLSGNISSLLTYRSKSRGAHDTAFQVDADLVWQEWQLAGQVRQIAADLISLEQSRPVYERSYSFFADRLAKSRTALAAGNLTLSALAVDQSAFQAARAARDGVEQKRLSLRHQLNALLGLSPDVVVPLADTVDLPPFDPDRISAILPELDNRRPDLIALRWGYAQQEEQVRQAVLLQFPDLTLGATENSDNSKVINGGPNIAVAVPVFDAGHTAVTAAQATRAQLRDEYAARLQAASGEAHAMLTEIAQMDQQLRVTQADLPRARAAAARAAEALSTGAIDARAYTDLAQAEFTEEEDTMTLKVALLDKEIALETLIGADLPTLTQPLPQVDGAK